MRISDWSSDVCSSDLAACGSDVILSRATKVDGTPTVPARWLLRLDAMLKGDARWAATKAPRYLAWAEQLDQPDAAVRSEPPMPRPPVEARPRSLYVTDIQRSEEHTSEPQSLMRISYAVSCLQKK